MCADWDDIWTHRNRLIKAKIEMVLSYISGLSMDPDAAGVLGRKLKEHRSVANKLLIIV
jgi:hypothetical protein